MLLRVELQGTPPHSRPVYLASRSVSLKHPKNPTHVVMSSESGRPSTSNHCLNLLQIYVHRAAHASIETRSERRFLARNVSVSTLLPLKASNRIKSSAICRTDVPWSRQLLFQKSRISGYTRSCYIPHTLQSTALSPANNHGMGLLIMSFSFRHAMRDPHETCSHAYTPSHQIRVLPTPGVHALSLDIFPNANV